MAGTRTSANKSVVVTVSKEVLNHYTCYGCHKWFTIGDCVKDPSHCPNCGKRILRIEENKNW